MRGGSEAFDFAVTSGLQSGNLAHIIDTPETIFSEYEAKKREYQGTEAACTSVGVKFTPLVLEAHGGGMSLSMRKFIDWLASGTAAASGSNRSSEALRIAQRISATLHRESARAILRRLAPAAEASPTTPWADWVPHTAACV